MLTLLVLALAAPGLRAQSGNAARTADQTGPMSSARMQGYAERLQQVAPDLAPKVLALALRASACAVRSGFAADVSKLAVIDYSRPSTDRRLWVFDVKSAKLLFAEHVAHGQASGENMTRHFSNLEGSHQSSLGLFLTSDTYLGENGYSLNLDGLEPGINDRARERRIVMHGAAYVDPSRARDQGRLGRSHGCPALRPAVAGQVIDALKGGHLLFAYYPDTKWIDRSPFLNCGDVDTRTGSRNASQSISSTDASRGTPCIGRACG